MGTEEKLAVSKMGEDHSAELVKNLEELCRNVKESLQKAEERFRIAVENMGNWEYWIGQNNNYIFVSPACEKVTGYKPEEFVEDQNLFLKIVHPEDREHLSLHIEEEQKNGETASLDFRIISRSGEQRFIVHKCRRVYDHAGNSLGIRATNYDLTDIKNIEAEKHAFENRIRNYASTIEQIGKLAMESVNNFNNMVQKILGCVELLNMESNRTSVINEQKGLQKYDLKFSSPAVRIPNENATVQTVEESRLAEEPLADYSCNYQGKILLVDDEKFILDMASDMLKVVNFDVMTACTGAEAIDLFRKNKDEITCVVLDLNMPDYDGKAIFEELSKIKEDIPILLSSGSNEQEVRQRFSELQPLPFLQKPYHFSTLVAKVNKLMQKHNCALV